MNKSKTIRIKESVLRNVIREEIESMIQEGRKRAAIKQLKESVPDWFLELSPQQQKAYLKQHPNSKVTKGVKKALKRSGVNKAVRTAGKAIGAGLLGGMLGAKVGVGVGGTADAGGRGSQLGGAAGMAASLAHSRQKGKKLDQLRKNLNAYDEEE